MVMMLAVKTKIHRTCTQTTKFIVHMSFQLIYFYAKVSPQYGDYIQAEVKIFPHIPQTKLILLVIIYIFLSDGRLAFHQRKPFEETFETHSGIPQMQPVWLCIFWGRQFENALKKTLRSSQRHIVERRWWKIRLWYDYKDDCDNYDDGEKLIKMIWFYKQMK